MKTTRNLRATAALTLAVALLTVGCSSDGGSDADPKPGNGGSETTTTVAEPTAEQFSKGTLAFRFSETAEDFVSGDRFVRYETADGTVSVYEADGTAAAGFAVEEITEVEDAAAGNGWLAVIGKTADGDRKVVVQDIATGEVLLSEAATSPKPRIDVDAGKVIVSSDPVPLPTGEFKPADATVYDVEAGAVEFSKTGTASEVESGVLVVANPVDAATDPGTTFYDLESGDSVGSQPGFGQILGAHPGTVTLREYEDPVSKAIVVNVGNAQIQELSTAGEPAPTASVVADDSASFASLRIQDPNIELLNNDGAIERDFALDVTVVDIRSGLITEDGSYLINGTDVAAYGDDGALAGSKSVLTDASRARFIGIADGWLIIDNGPAGVISVKA